MLDGNPNSLYSKESLLGEAFFTILNHTEIPMGKIKDNMAKMKCGECARITAYTKRNKKKVKEKLSLQKYCNFCRKHTPHNESK